MNSRRRNDSLAFTLLEILVAIALLALVVIAIYSSWNSIVKGSRVGMDAAAEAQRSRITMRTVHDAFLCACMFNANATNYVFEADSDNDFSTVSFVAHLPKSFPRSGKFGDLTTRRLTFAVQSSSSSNSRQLVLRQRPLIMDFDRNETDFPLVLARDVTKFIVEYLDPKTGDWTKDWVNSNTLPREIRITLGLGRLDQYSTKQQDELVSVVAPPAMPVPQDWQLPNVGGGAGANGTNGTGANGTNGIGTGTGTGVNPGQKVISIPSPR